MEEIGEVGESAIRARRGRVVQEAHRGLTEKLSHRPTHSFFTFSTATEGKLWLSWWPGEGNTTAYYPWASGGDTLVRNWITEVKRNDNAPDLWAEAAKARVLTDAAGRVESKSTPFDLAEIELLKPKLDEVEAYIQSRQALDPEQTKALRGRFQYLLGAAKRLGRIDWLNIVVSQLFQLVTEGVLHSSLYGEVMRHAAALVKIGGKLLGSG